MPHSSIVQQAPAASLKDGRRLHYVPLRRGIRVVKTTHPVLRATGAGVLFAVIAALGLLIFPPLLSVILFVLGPAGVALLLAGRPVDRDTFYRNAYGTALAAGLTGAAWIGAFADDDTEPIGVAVGAIVSFILLGFFAAAGSYLVGRWIDRRQLATARPPARYRDRDE
jgi:apolipoprotein N-acyltransferase